MKVLIVEDDANSRVFLERALLSQGYTVESAANGLQALEKASLSPPDLIISDIMMPKMDGFELCRRVKTDERFRTIPFVFYTATYIDQKDEKLAIAIGASLFLIKPMEPEKFFRAIRKVIKEQRAGHLPVPDQLPAEMTELDRMQMEVYARKLDKKVRELEKERDAIRRAEEELTFRNVILSTQQEASIDGILVVDESGRILSFNRRFRELWNIPSEILETRSDERTLQSVLDNIVDPDNFLQKVRYLYEHRQETSRDEISLRDGRIFDRYSAPMFGVDGRYYGRVWYFRDITERKRAEEDLRSEKTFTENALNSLSDVFFIFDFNGKFLRWNKKLNTVLGYSDADISSMQPVDFFLKEDVRRVLEAIEMAVRNGYAGLEARVLTKDGRNIPYEFSGTLLKNLEGKPVAICGIGRDITERKQAEEMMQNLRHHNELILNSTGEGIIGLDFQGNHTFINPSAAGMLGYESKELIGKHSHAIWHHSIDDGSTYPEDKCPIYATLKDGSVNHNVRDEVFWRKDGTNFSVAYSSNPIMDEGKIIGAVVNFRDITERKKMAEKLQYLAYYDSLTDLPNRNLFFDRVNQAIARAEYTSRIVAVLITNIDRFKSINDTYGSEIGDRVLKEIAGRLSTSVRKGDTIARLSNDEFGIALLDVAHADDIVMVLEKIIKDISYPLKVDRDELVLTFSTGVSLYPNDGKSASELLKAAGLALGTAKKERMKPYQFFTEDLNIKASELILMEKGLHKAITKKEFILHYQPYWDINTKKMVGMEALIRWQSKDKGLVPPGKFIPVLEDTGMIIEVGEWILREALRQVKEWQNNGYPVVPVSVNMSLVQFRQKNLAEMVKRIMGEFGFYPSHLTLEITESAFMQDIEFTRSVLTAMKEIGCSVSIDDFGTGYSSLAYLKRFPVDNLKIDISFIREVVRDPDSASIVMAIINMAHTLNLKTIAEGIETEEQWNFLRLLRCDMGQGFYLSKPLPAVEIEMFFKKE